MNEPLNLQSTGSQDIPASGRPAAHRSQIPSEDSLTLHPASLVPLLGIAGDTMPARPPDVRGRATPAAGLSRPMEGME